MPSPAMTEAQLQAAVLDLAKWLAVAAYHTHDSRRSQAGFPDLVLAGPRGVIFRELKTAKGRLSAAQADWLRLLEGPNAATAVWRPADWRSGRIKEELQEIR